MNTLSASLLPNDVKVFQDNLNGYKLHIFHGMKIGNGFLYTFFLCGTTVMGFGGLLQIITNHNNIYWKELLLFLVFFISGSIFSIYFGYKLLDAIFGRTILTLNKHIMKIDKRFIVFKKESAISVESIETVLLLKNEFIPTNSDDTGHDTWELKIIGKDHTTEIINRDSEEVPKRVGEFLSQFYNLPFNNQFTS